MRVISADEAAVLGDDRHVVALEDRQQIADRRIVRDGLQVASPSRVLTGSWKRDRVGMQMHHQVRLVHDTDRPARPASPASATRRTASCADRPCISVSVGATASPRRLPGSAARSDRADRPAAAAPAGPGRTSSSRCTSCSDTCCRCRSTSVTTRLGAVCSRQ